MWLGSLKARLGPHPGHDWATTKPLGPAPLLGPSDHLRPRAPCAPAAAVSPVRGPQETDLTLGSSQAPGGRGVGAAQGKRLTEVTRAQQGGQGVLKTTGHYTAQRGHPWGPRNGGLWTAGEHGGFPTYPGHVGRVAGLIVRQVARMVAAAGHGADGRVAALLLSLRFRGETADSSLRRAGIWSESAPCPPWVGVPVRPWTAGPRLPAPHVLHRSGRSSARSPWASQPRPCRVISGPGCARPPSSWPRRPTRAPGDPLTKSVTPGRALRCSRSPPQGVRAARGRPGTCSFASRVLIGLRHAARSPAPAAQWLGRGPRGPFPRAPAFARPHS